MLTDAPGARLTLHGQEDCLSQRLPPQEAQAYSNNPKEPFSCLVTTGAGERTGRLLLKSPSDE